LACLRLRCGPGRLRRWKQVSQHVIQPPDERAGILELAAFGQQGLVERYRYGRYADGRGTMSSSSLALVISFESIR